MPTKTIAELHAELHLFRRAHHGAALKAAIAYPLVQRLQSAWIWLPREKTLSHLARSIYFNSGNDACETYESVEDFQVELTFEVEAAWPPAVSLDGQAGFMLKPFFNALPLYFSDLRVGSLHGCDINELSALEVDGVPARAPCLNTLSLAGLSREELAALVQFHHDKALAIVNALRHLTTALHYLQTELKRGLTLGPRGEALRHDEEIAALVDALGLAVQLPFLPAPASHYGTEASRVNPLRALPRTEDALACLLATPAPAGAGAADHVRVLISNRPGGFHLAPSVVKAMFEQSPEYFGESFPVSLFQSTAIAVERAYPNSVLHADQISFLEVHEPRVRTDAWLIEQFDRLGEAALVGECCRTLKAVAVPADAAWQIYVMDDGSERVQEQSRSWD